MVGNMSHPRNWGRPMSVALAAGLAAVALLTSACGSSSDGKSKSVAAVPGSTGPQQQAGSGGAAGGGGGQLSDQALYTALLSYSKCMRSHGVTKFPDPVLGKGLAVSGDVGQATATYTAAGNACKSLMPAGPPDGGSRNRAAALKYSACMRSHGVTKFPDSNQNGALSLDGSKIGMDLKNPIFVAADTACQKLMGNGSNGTTQGG
jgi:hypothetical protein